VFAIGMLLTRRIFASAVLAFTGLCKYSTTSPAPFGKVTPQARLQTPTHKDWDGYVARAMGVEGHRELVQQIVSGLMIRARS
jgi:hypothetical protein